MIWAGPRVLRSAVLLFLFPATLAACVTGTGGLDSSESPAADQTVAPVPISRQSHIAEGRALLAAREPDLAMKAFLRAIASDGLSVEAVTGAGIAARQQGLLKESRSFLEQAVRLAADSPSAHYNLGVVLFQLNEYHAARDAFRTAFALSSGESELAATNLNRTEEIVALLEQNPELDPTISHDVVRLGGGQFRLVDAEPAETEVIAE